MDFQSALADYSWVLPLIALWTIPWKGWALWTSARRSQKWWFIALLVINTVGLLEIFYLFAIAKVQDKKGAEEKKPAMPDAPKDTPKM